MARLTETVVFPTPPLPLPTAMMFLTPGMGSLACVGLMCNSILRNPPATRSPALQGLRRSAVGIDQRTLQQAPVRTQNERDQGRDILGLSDAGNSILLQEACLVGPF